MSALTFDDIYRTVEAVIEGDPNRTNGYCSHFYEGKPQCVVGHVFAAFEDARLVEHAKNRALAEHAARDAGFDQNSIDYLSELQAYADEGGGNTVTWRTAKRRADEAFGLVDA